MRNDSRHIIKTPIRKTADIESFVIHRTEIQQFREGNYLRMYRKMGAHFCTCNGEAGVHFAVWAPNARSVSVIGSFNNWDAAVNPLYCDRSSGIWSGFVANVCGGDLYKYQIISNSDNFTNNKADPFSLHTEVPPGTASRIWDISYRWNDREWMSRRQDVNSLNSPISIYEVHIGSWQRTNEENNRFLTYREMAEKLASYVIDMGFTHVEFLPVMEHPFYGSWGYQITGFFAPTSRYGSPQDFMFLIDYLHQHNIGVILDWVPSHFPNDEHGLALFDGDHLYEHSDPRKGLHPDWNSLIFNFEKPEVRSFLLSSALFWLDYYHADGIRVDSVASLLYLDYSRKDGEWLPNKYGGRENLDAIDFLRRFNEVVYREYPDVQTFAEESSAWPMVSRPVYAGGLGFGMKWDMGWMNDILEYLRINPKLRKYQHNKLTFRMLYAFCENFLLPLSHDEVVYGKGSLLQKMPGDESEKYASLRLLLSYLFTQAGKKLLFMGGEFGQVKEWDHETGLDWHLLKSGAHNGIRLLVSDLNRLYRNEPALYENDFCQAGFEWIDCNDAENSTVIFLRKGKIENDIILVACNFSALAYSVYRIGVPFGGWWQEMLNSNASHYGGSGVVNDQVHAEPVQYHGKPFSIVLAMPPLSVVIIKPTVK